MSDKLNPLEKHGRVESNKSKGEQKEEFEYDFDKESPFQPGKPVSPDYFSGRKKIVAKILRYVNKAHNGDAQHYFNTFYMVSENFFGFINN